jgi:pimeloyl-ACP methyl ester carboxylesterase
MAIPHLEVPMKMHQLASAMEDDSQGARRATEKASSIAPPPDPEVAASAKRRQFSGSDRRRILAAADRCSKTGEIGALLRREGIYSSQLTTWRRQREATERVGLEPKKRGRKADPAIAEARRVAELTYERRSEAGRRMMMDNALERVADARASSQPPLFTCEMAKRITAPTLLMTGARSPAIFHRIVDELERCVPNRERVVIPDASHTVPGENPKGFDEAVLAFLVKH